MRAAVLAILLVPGLLALPARAQQPAATPEQPTFRTGVGLVRVDVTVSGPKDAPIDDLTADDFEVREDGAAQAIQSLQFVRRTGARVPGDDTALEIRSVSHAAAEAAREDVRLLVIFIDDYHLRYGPLFDGKLKRMLHGFVDAEMRETDLFAVMGPLTPMDDLGLTRSKPDLLDRIDHVQGRLGGFVPPRSALEESQMYVRGADRARIRAEVTLSALESLANHLGAMGEGRKSVLFVSEGPNFLGGTVDVSARLRDIVIAANRSNVTIHTLDPRALGESRGPGFVNDALAAETGGRRLAQSNDYSKGLRAVMADASTYYLIGYSPARPPSDGKFHEIDVRVKRKGVRVLARKGYWAPTAEESRPRRPLPTAPVEITTALTRLPARPHQARVDWWLGFEHEERGTLTTMSWERADRAEASPREAVARLSIDLVDATDFDAVVVAAAGDTAAASGPWQAQFRLPPGAQRLRVRAESADGEVLDEWTEQVDVPDLTAARPGLGTPRFYRAASPAAWRSLVADPRSSVPMARRGLRRTDRVLVTVPVSPASPTLRAELVNRQGKVLLTLPLRAGGGEGLPQIELPLANLAQAEYVLRVVAEQDGRAVSQAAAFAVVP